MQYSAEVEHMCPVAKGAYHGPAPIPEEGKWVQAKEVSDISGLTHGVGWCAPQQGACKLTLNVKDGIIEEALIETIGCSGMTHSAAMASEILPGKTILEDGLTGKDLGSHGGGVRHAGAADGFDQRLLDDAVLDVQRELAGALLGGAPTHAVGEAGDVGDLLGLDPLALLGDGRGAVVCALGDRAHVFHFC